MKYLFTHFKKVISNNKGFWQAALPWLATTAAAALGVMSSEKEASAAKKANVSQIEQAQEQRNWEEMMFKNRHQFEVADLKAAGLNPILSANSGGSVPSGAMASIRNPYEGYSSNLTSSAKAVTDIARSSGEVTLNNERASTERTQQMLNRSANRVSIATAKEAEANAIVAQKSIGAKVAAEKAAATVRAVDSANAITRSEFDRSFTGKGLIRVNRALRLLFGSDNK